MEPLLTSEQMREVDRNTIQALGIPEIVLMEHAALAVVETLSCRFGRVLPETKGIVLAGPGNNGADALATVRLLHERGCHSIFVVLVEGGEPSQLSPLTTLQLGILGKLGIPWGKKLSKELLEASDWVIDGIFGTGLKRDLSPKTTKTIELLNQFAGSKWILSVDVPSGLSSDTGKPRGIAVKASQTVTLGFVKRGLVTAEGADYVGDLKLSPIQIPRLLPFAVDTFWYKK
jgi:NAD(P)H-hydrate epimerase